MPDHKFTKPLQLLNKKKSVTHILEFLIVNLRNMLRSYQNPSDLLAQLTAWLILEVNGNKMTIDEAAAFLWELISSCRQELADCEKEETASFLTECLRCMNFAKHKSSVVAKFVALFEELNIKLVGDPETCIEQASFKDLSASKGVVTMIPQGK